MLVLHLTLVTAVAAILGSTNGSGAHKLMVGFQAPWNLSLPFSALRMGSALQLAMEKVNNNPSILGNYSLDFVFLDTECDPKISLGGFIHQVWKENVSALFGPACPEEAEVQIAVCVLVLELQFHRFRPAYLSFRSELMLQV